MFIIRITIIDDREEEAGDAATVVDDLSILAVLYAEDVVDTLALVDYVVASFASSHNQLAVLEHDILQLKEYCWATVL